MRVGIDLGGLTGGHAVRGIGVHTSQLWQALEQESKGTKKFKISKYSPGKKYDLVHFTVFKPFVLSLPFNKPAPKVILTIHDLTPLIYPKHYPPGVKGKLIFFLQKILIHRSVDAIITISETSKKDICRFLGAAPEKVFVIYLAPREIFKKVINEKALSQVSAKYKLPRDFVLYVGDVNYNKNIPNLIKACQIADLPLVICGKQAKEIERMDLNHPELRHLKDINWSGVKRLGFVPDIDLPAIYSLAKVYCQPSYYEGFGLPVLEALTCGCPVVVAKTQALVEIATEDVAFVDPQDPDDIARGLNGPFQKLKSELPGKYSWAKTAKKTLNVYTQI